VAKIIESFEDVNTEWISQVLDVSSNAISSFTVAANWETPVTQVALINIAHKHSDQELPTSIFVKIAKREQHKELREMCGREVLFYSEIAYLMKVTCIPRCYYAGRDEQSGSFTIVLEDLSATHFQTDYPLPPTFEYCEMAVDCLAKIHATWWIRQGSETVLGPYPQNEEIKEQILEWTTYHRRAWADFSNFMGDRLSQSRRKLIEKTLSSVDRSLGRYLSNDNLTLTHTDTHLWNFLFPKDSGGEAKLIDWQSYRYGLGVDDLVPMIALNWYPERRQRFERPMLSKYHITLVNNGIKEYSWEDLLTEYRWSVVRGLFVPIWQWDHKVGAFIWYNNLEKILLAFQDLNCMELLE
jgi:hypothetical protein